MSLVLAAVQTVAAPCVIDVAETARDVRYPISRWYARPLALAVVRYGACRGWEPAWFTWANLAIAVLAALAIVAATPAAWLIAAVGVWLAWFCDRIDGPLARARGCASPWGAWLDGNIDEVTDLGWQAAVAVAATSAGYAWAGSLFAAFVCGKYLFLHGLQAPAGVAPSGEGSGPSKNGSPQSLTSFLYHLPANADVRLHLLVVTLVVAAWQPACLVIELLACAAYYNTRWLARYVLMYRRLTSTQLRSV